MKSISIVTPCYNEEENVRDVYEQVKQVFFELGDFNYEHIFIDNASSDNTVSILKEIACQDPNVKIIINSRNFGHIRSPYYALLQSTGDAAILLVADLQDPPCMIKDFIQKWEDGYKIIVGVKTKSEETWILYKLRTLYYRTLHWMADVELIENFTGFGMYDRTIIDILKRYNDPYPYFRGLITDIGFEIAKIEYTQPSRKRGITKNNFFTLYDMAMLGLTTYTKIPLRMMTMFGFLTATISFLLGLFYLVYKLIDWQNFSLGLAPVTIGLFFFGSIQLIFLGIVGEYIGAIYTRVLNRPLVIEKERINF